MRHALACVVSCCVPRIGGGIWGNVSSCVFVVLLAPRAFRPGSYAQSRLKTLFLRACIFLLAASRTQSAIPELCGHVGCGAILSESDLHQSLAGRGSIDAGIPRLMIRFSSTHMYELTRVVRTIECLGCQRLRPGRRGLGVVRNGGPKRRQARVSTIPQGATSCV